MVVEAIEVNVVATNEVKAAHDVPGEVDKSKSLVVEAEKTNVVHVVPNSPADDGHMDPIVIHSYSLSANKAIHFNVSDRSNIS